MNTVKKLTQLNRTCFTQLRHDITKSFENKVKDFMKKWEDLIVLDKKWVNYIKYNYCTPGTMKTKRRISYDLLQVGVVLL